ncbi:MAG: LPS export ABC transporter periplasmic protein LptC [Armatimonadetes bacterium]|nr:LPS export ABC transporter periplasmic protein LptC [Armatimonadota bacterium]
MKRWAAGGLIVAAAAGVAVAWLLAESPLQGEEVTPARPPVAISKATIVLRSRGGKLAEITAERVELSPDGQTTTFSGIPRAVVYMDETPVLTATGGRIVVERQSQDVRLDGGLRITTARGEVLVAQSASWHQQAQVLDLEGGVEITFPVQGRPR